MVNLFLVEQKITKIDFFPLFWRSTSMYRQIAGFNVDENRIDYVFKAVKDFRVAWYPKPSLLGQSNSPLGK